MPSKPDATPRRVACIFARGAMRRCALALVLGLAASAGVIGLVASARADAPSADAALLGGLCADTLRPNEEDRLYGLISITVRATIKYRGGVFSPDLIDDSVQDALGALLDACPKIVAAAEAQRLGMAVGVISDATVNRMADPKSGYSDRQTERASAADLSEELSSQEIDAWLDALPARERALALLLYASNVTREEMADAVGLSLPALAVAFRGAKIDLLKFFREEWIDAPPPPTQPSPGMEYREAGVPLADLIRPDSGRAFTAHITGISGDIFAGWSLLATLPGLPADRNLDLAQPILVEPDRPGRKRMIVVGADEIGSPHELPRRFLLKAFAIDGDREGAGLHDTFRFSAAALDNPQAQQTLRNPSLTSIEIARCLWFDYRTGVDPGLCR
jgi:DNA-directed RNA polymerase specialized sigma24 family protein